ncbi:MAG: HAD hydrolase-like protein [Planctomycetes bacterium]|jgi:beta-phosphoglucomutase-like phosphatase (HAD superfamily)|nr:HAD hydrolase-like protein [Phycisphaerae bacterium]NBB94554.1 HAD hydrolase-like protein [Planctomycetota bacterium]
MDAMILDFDGVLVDSEPVDLQAFRTLLAEEGVELADAMYYERCLGHDDRVVDNLLAVTLEALGDLINA